MRGKNCGSEISSVEKSFSYHTDKISLKKVLRAFCCLRDDLQILIFFARQKKSILCCLRSGLVKCDGDLGEIGLWDMDLLLLPPPFIFLPLSPI